MYENWYNLKFRIHKSLTTQKKIAHILSVIDEKIELNKKINKKLEELARLLYEYYFVQFDFPDINGKPYKSSGGEMVYNEKLKRKIPKGWEVETILDSKITKIISPNIKKFKNKKIYLSTSDVEGSEIVNHKTLITFDNRPSRAAMQPLENSIWFARMKNTKKRILVSDFSDYLINNYIFSTGFAGLKVKKNALYYVWEYVNSEKFEELKDKFATGSTQKAITNEGLKNIYILIPSDSILSKFNLSVKPIFQQIYNNQLQIQKLEKLRDFLLPMLLNGQVTISEKWKVEN
jgi:type I restriction enzyme S subunit